MILILKKDKVVLLGLVFLLAITLLSFNFRSDPKAIETSGTGQRVVIIDAGHGGEDPGAVSDYNQIKEKDINLHIALRVKELLEAESYKVIMTRDEDILQYRDNTKGYTKKRMQDLTRRKKVMDEESADIVVSIHLNKFGQTQYHGAQAFFPPKPQASKKLADLIQKSLRETVDPENKREALVKNTQEIILRNAKKPTVIVECGFLSNQEEEQKLASKEYQEKLAQAIKNGISKYYQ
jgi:N-acetylmuramoyl-L-alanine amidase